MADNDINIPATDGQMVLQAENLVKKYGKRTVVNNVSFNVKQGEIVGLLGPNAFAQGHAHRQYRKCCYHRPGRSCYNR